MDYRDWIDKNGQPYIRNGAEAVVVGVCAVGIGILILAAWLGVGR